MTAPDWMVKMEVNDQSETQKKIAKAQSGDKAKKQKPSRHIRTRARLPTSGPEKDYYNLPGWVVDDSFKGLMLQVLKTLANTQQRLRQLEAVIADNFVVPAAITPVVAGVTMAEAYHKRAISGSGDDIGAPGPQVLYAFCEAMVTSCDIGDDPRF